MSDGHIIGKHLRLPVALSAGAAATRFFDGVRRGEIHGLRCPSCATLYVPPRTVCARCWVRTTSWEQVHDTGVIEGFVVVNVPFYGQQVEIPYVLADVLLDGADTSFKHLVGIAADDGALKTIPVRTGMRVRAVWRDERTGFLSEDIDHFMPAVTRDG